MHQTLEQIFTPAPPASRPFFLIAGPCVLEDEDMGFVIADRLAAIARSMYIPFVFKASYKKANRTRLDSFSGLGDEKALDLLGAIRQQCGVAVLTDVHTAQEASLAASRADILQIPAFLCRQTELLMAAGKTGRAVNIKKGQFLSPSSMGFATEKVMASGNNRVMLTERGSCFGYGDLVVDFRSIPIMQQLKVPVVLDATHSLQQPDQGKGVSGGLPHLIETIAKAGIAAGADGLFIETHPDPGRAKSDGANMIKLDKVEALLEKLLKIKSALG